MTAVVVAAIVRTRWAAVTAAVGAAVGTQFAAIAILVLVAVITVVAAGRIARRIVFVKILAALASVSGRLFPIIAEHTVIMIGILQIIFGGYPVAGLLRITRQGAVFLEQLAGVAALAIVQPVTVIVAAVHLLRTRAVVIAAAATPVLVVSDQLGVPV